MARLEILEGENAGTSIPLEDEIILGRSVLSRPKKNFIHLPDTRISRQHARIVRRGWIFLLEDLGSSNGTILRGEIIQPRMSYDLYDRDEIWLSSFRLRFHLEEDTLTAQDTPTDLEGAAKCEDTMAVSTETIQIEGVGPFSVMMVDDTLVQSELSVVLDASQVIPEHSGPAEPAKHVLQNALKRLQAMCEVSMALGLVTERDKLMQRIMDCIFDLFPVVDRTFIMLRIPQGGKLTPVAVKKRLEDAEKPEEMTISRTIIDAVVVHKRSILSFDTFNDRRFNTHESVLNMPLRSVMCAPLLVGDEVLGIIQADTATNPKAFTAEDLQVFTGISAQAAIAVKNTQLYEAIEIETAQRTSLQRYFSPNLVEMLMSGDFSTKLGGSTYWGTILFADIIGFTAMSESMSAVDVVTRLNRYFTSMQSVIYDNGGNVDKFGGDDIMAFWSVPQRGLDDECDAVRTGLQMQAKLWASNLRLEAEGHASIYMGIGINTGEFVAGNIGSKDKIEFTLIGDTVNLAARIVKLSARYQVLISESTWKPIKHLVSAVQLPSTLVKGRSQPVPLYSIRAVPYRTRNAYVLALPCAVLDNAGQNHIGRGILTESIHIGSDLRLFFSTDMPLTTSHRLVLQPIMSEYHQVLRFSARVESCAATAYDGDLVYTKAILTEIHGRGFIHFLTPGSCLVTNYTWNNLRRR